VRRAPALGAALALAIAAPDSSAVDAAALARKEQAFRAALHQRHLAPEGVVLYRVRLSRLPDDLASGRYPELADTPTFTGIFASASCARARVPGERDSALADARRALEGLRLLMDVTGRRGLLARAIRRDEGLDFAELRHPEQWRRAAPPLERFGFRGDASQDQYANGLLLAVASCRELHPELARGLALDFAAHLEQHDLRIVDEDGAVTRYGNLGPLSALGWNAVALLTSYGAFALADELYPGGGWGERRRALRDRWRNVARARITNLRVLGITNHSNDLMTLHLLHALLPLARSSGDPAAADLRHALWRAWLRVRSDQSPYFAALFCHTEPESCDRAALASGLELLERFPLDKTRHALDPSLLDLSRRLLPGRKGALRARSPVAIEIRPPSSFEWKSSPYRVEGIVDPDVEYTGLDFVAAYWLYRSLPASLRASLGL
jgi:hypothetical protein